MSDFDAIVVGSGISGGWTAKELCERGLKVLMIERGPDIDPSQDYTDHLSPWEEAELPPLTQEERNEHYKIQSSSYAFNAANKKFWVRDDLHPYETVGETAFMWRRGYHLGGRSLTWERQSYRMAPMDFLSNRDDGYGVDWPIRYQDLAPWYSHVERFAGISGTRENIAELPDGEFLEPFEMTCAEETAKRKIEAAFPGRHFIPGRTANLSKSNPVHEALGRASCQARYRCKHGCAYGAYFSSISATLPAAKQTGNLTILSDTIVDTLEFDEATGRVSGVNTIGTDDRLRNQYTARMVFLNASAVASALILLNSKSERFPTGLANDSDQVGRNLMDHVGGAYAVGIMDDNLDKYYSGRRPNGIYIPRYVNLDGQSEDFARGFGFQGRAYRKKWTGDRPGIGEAFKAANQTPGPWQISLGAFGEALPNPENRVILSDSKKDRWGIPIPVFDVKFGENERKMMAKASQDATAMLEAAGATVIDSSELKPLEISKPGDVIHEMGTIRMGRDAATSVLNGWNHAHGIPNLFVTDGAAMTSSACQNPSLTYMALSARAANYAADLMEQGKL